MGLQNLVQSNLRSVKTPQLKIIKKNEPPTKVLYMLAHVVAKLATQICLDIASSPNVRADR